MTRIERLVREFAEGVAGQTDALGRGDVASGDRHAERYIRAFESLRAIGDEGRDALAPLMCDARNDVRVVAAAYLLRHRHDEARRVLQELARGRGFTAFRAQEALKRWDEGAWQLDPA